MSVHLLCAIRDAAADTFSPPFCAPTRGAAIRMFGDAVVKEGSQMGVHPAHFELFQIGVYDDHDGSIVGEKVPSSLALALDYALKGGAHAHTSETRQQAS